MEGRPNTPLDRRQALGLVLAVAASVVAPGVLNKKNTSSLGDEEEYKQKTDLDMFGELSIVEKERLLAENMYLYFATAREQARLFTEFSRKNAHNPDADIGQYRVPIADIQRARKAYKELMVVLVYIMRERSANKEERAKQEVEVTRLITKLGDMSYEELYFLFVTRYRELLEVSGEMYRYLPYFSHNTVLKYNAAFFEDLLVNKFIEKAENLTRSIERGTKGTEFATDCSYEYSFQSIDYASLAKIQMYFFRGIVMNDEDRKSFMNRVQGYLHPALLNLMKSLEYVGIVPAELGGDTILPLKEITLAGFSDKELNTYSVVFELLKQYKSSGRIFNLQENYQLGNQAVLISNYLLSVNSQLDLERLSEEDVQTAEKFLEITYDKYARVPLVSHTAFVSGSLGKYELSDTNAFASNNLLKHFHSRGVKVSAANIPSTQKPEEFLHVFRDEIVAQDPGTFFVFESHGNFYDQGTNSLMQEPFLANDILDGDSARMTASHIADFFCERYTRNLEAYETAKNTPEVITIQACYSGNFPTYIADFWEKKNAERKKMGLPILPEIIVYTSTGRNEIGALGPNTSDANQITPMRALETLLKSARSGLPTIKDINDTKFNVVGSTPTVHVIGGILPTIQII